MVTLAVAAIVPNLGLSAGATALAGVAGGLLGAYVDSAFIMPALFPPPEPEPQDIAKLQMASYNEGSPINLVMGPKVRVEGQVIWAGKPTYTELVTSISPGTGKGGGGQKQIEIQYTIDVAVAIGEAPMNPNTGVRSINKVTKIIANGNRLYESASNININSNKIYSTAFSTAGEYWYVTSIAEKRHWPYHYLRISSDDSAGGPDLSVFSTGTEAVVSGFVNSVNNGTFEVTKVGQDPTTSDTFIEVFLGVASTSDSTASDPVHYPYPISNVVTTTGGVSESIGNSITLTQTNPKFEADDATSITVYDGTQSSADPLIAAWAGETVPVHNGIAYVVIEGLKLNNFGNSIPTFTIDVEANVAPFYVSEAITQILLRSGIGLNFVSIDSALDSVEFDGMAVRGQVESTKALQPIFTAYNVSAQIDSDGYLRFFHRSNAYRHVIDENDLSVVPDGSALEGVPFVLEEFDQSKLPTQVVVNHIDAALDYTQATQKERRVNFSNDVVQNVSLPMTLTPDVAKSVASRLLWLQSSSKGKFVLQLPHKYAKISESDEVQITRNGKTWYGFVDRVERGDNYAIRLECTEINPNAAFQTVSVDLKHSKIVPGAKFNRGPAVQLSAADIPSLSQDQNDKSGIFYWGNAYNQEDPWFGAIVEARNVSTNDPYTPLNALTSEAWFGIMEDSLGAPPGTSGEYFGGWDWRLNSTGPVVEMRSGVLGNATESEIVTRGYNKALIGNEIVHFREATLVGTDRYRLDGFIRGVQGTDNAFDDHFATERFLLLNSNGNVQFQGGIQFEDFGLKNLDSLYGLIGASDSRSLATTSPYYLEANGETLKPFSIGWYRTFRWMGGQVGLSFFARSRNFEPTLQATPSDLRLFEIDSMNGPLVRNTYKIDDTGGATTPGKSGAIVNWVYTAAQQARDGIVPGAQVTLNVYQINPAVGRGKPRTIVIS